MIASRFKARKSSVKTNKGHFEASRFEALESCSKANASDLEAYESRVKKNCFLRFVALSIISRYLNDKILYISRCYTQYESPELNSCESL